MYQDVLPFWEAFCFLSAGRRFVDSTPLPINSSEILDYCILNRIAEEEEVNFLISAVRALNIIWIEDALDKSKKAKQQRDAEAKRKSKKK